MIYRGGCHCGQIAFEVEGDLTQVAAIAPFVQKWVRFTGSFREENFCCSLPSRPFAPTRSEPIPSGITFVPNAAFILSAKELILLATAKLPSTRDALRGLMCHRSP